MIRSRGVGAGVVGLHAGPVAVVLMAVGFEGAAGQAGQGSEAGSEGLVPIDEDGVDGQIGAETGDACRIGDLRHTEAHAERLGSGF